MKSSIEEIIRSIVADEVAAAEKRIRSELSEFADRTMDVVEAAAHIGISEKLVYRLCQERTIPHERYGVTGSRKPTIKFRLADLEAWRAEQRAINSAGLGRG